MTATGHAIIGTVIAAKVGNPALAVPIVLASHVAADAFPHWNEATSVKGKNRIGAIIEAASDVVIGFVLSYLIITLLFPQTNLAYAFLIIVVAQSFDWLTAPWQFFGIKLFKPFYKFQKLFDNQLDRPWGVTNQIVILVLLVIVAKIF